MTKARGLYAGVALIVAVAEPASAQEEDFEGIVLRMRACSQIEDIATRVACYDDTIAAPDAASPLPASAAPASTQPNRRDETFGSESLPVKPSQAREGRADEIEIGVRSAAEREPGIYLLTLDDGAQWQFVDAVPVTYEAPRKGATISIRRGGAGGFLMRYEGQGSVRVKRVR